MRPVLLRGVEVDGHRTDVRIADGVITAIRADQPVTDDDLVVDGAGGAVIPGLHDHHVHLLAAAAAAASIVAGPPDVATPTAFAEALRQAHASLPRDRWLRAVGYHESVSGNLDRAALDAIVPDRPVRVQDRSGARWTLNSAGCRAVGLDDLTRPRPPGAEVDAHGEATGRLEREDRWLRARLPAGDAPDLAALGRRLLDLGVTGVTDATPVSDLDDLELLRAAGLPQHLQVTGGPELAGATFPAGLLQGPVKIIVSDHDLPALDDLVGAIATSHRAGRPVAVHSVTRAALVLTLAALDEAGGHDGDRIEHASVVPAELIPVLAERGLVVVTQPAFVSERGDDYLADVDTDDVDHLYRCASLLAAGVRVAGSTDAPFGPLDPWAAIEAATERRTPSGVRLGIDERLNPRSALDLFLSPLDDPGGPPRSVREGAPADLVLLDGPLDRVLAAPSKDAVAATIVGGHLHRA